MQIQNFVVLLRQKLAIFSIENPILSGEAVLALTKIESVAERYAENKTEIGISVEDELRPFCNLLYDYAVIRLGEEQESLVQGIYLLLARHIITTGVTHNTKFNRTEDYFLNQPIRISDFAEYILAYMTKLPMDNHDNYACDVFLESRLAMSRLSLFLKAWGQQNDLMLQIEQLDRIKKIIAKRTVCVYLTHASYDTTFYALSGRAAIMPRPCADQAHSFLIRCYCEVVRRLGGEISEQTLKQPQLTGCWRDVPPIELLRKNIFGATPNRERLISVFTELSRDEWLVCCKGVSLQTLFCCLLNEETYHDLPPKEMLAKILLLFKSDEKLYFENVQRNCALLFLLLEFYSRVRAANPANHTAWGAGMLSLIVHVDDRKAKLDGVEDIQKQLATKTKLEDINVTGHALTHGELKLFIEQIQVAIEAAKIARNSLSIMVVRGGLLARPSAVAAATGDSSSESSPESSASPPTGSAYRPAL